MSISQYGHCSHATLGDDRGDDIRLIALSPIKASEEKMDYFCNIICLFPTSSSKNIVGKSLYDSISKELSYHVKIHSHFLECFIAKTNFASTIVGQMVDATLDWQ